MQLSHLRRGLGLVDYAAPRFWLIDATPAFPAQLQALQRMSAETSVGFRARQV